MGRWMMIPLVGVTWVASLLNPSGSASAAQDTTLDPTPAADMQRPWAAGAAFITARQYRDPAGVEYLVAFVEYPSAAAAESGFDVIAGTATQGLAAGQFVSALELGDRALALSGVPVSAGAASLVLVQIEEEVLVLLATGPEPAMLPDLLPLASVVLDRSGTAAERLPGLGDLPPGTEELRTYEGGPES
jgi:hypothetical protein